MTGDHEDFVQRFSAAWKAREPEALAAVFAPGGVAIQPPVRRPFKAEEVAEYFRRVFALLPDMQLEPIAWAGRDDVVFIEWRATASMGDETVEWRGVDRFRIREGLAVDEEVYFDTLPHWERLDPSMRRGSLIDLDTPAPA